MVCIKTTPQSHTLLTQISVKIHISEDYVHVAEELHYKITRSFSVVT